MRTRIEVEGKQYGFRFEYDGHETCCFVEEDKGRDKNGLPVFELKGMGLAECHPGDRYDKRYGRKVAFQRAVKSFAPDDREVRMKFWQAFFAAGIKLPK